MCLLLRKAKEGYGAGGLAFCLLSAQRSREERGMKRKASIDFSQL